MGSIVLRRQRYFGRVWGRRRGTSGLVRSRRHGGRLRMFGLQRLWRGGFFLFRGRRKGLLPWVDGCPFLRRARDVSGGVQRIPGVRIVDGGIRERGSGKRGLL